MTYQVYTAGKIWHAPKFQALRSDGYGVNARWIDLDDDCDIVKNRKDLLWQICFETSVTATLSCSIAKICLKNNAARWLR